MISVATVSVLILPYLQVDQSFVIVAFLGASIGSLVPDVDANDAAIFHDDVRGLNGDIGEMINNFVSPILPFFGYGTKFLIYKPSVAVFDLFTDYSFEEKHRAFSHSILGVLTMTTVTGIYLIPILLFIDLFNPLYLSAFLFAYMIGAFLHMLEDSCTKTGIKWNTPFSDTKIKGEISTGKDYKKPHYFLYYLGILVAATFMLSTSDFNIPLYALTAGSLAALIFSWFVFMKAIAKVEVVR